MVQISLSRIAAMEICGNPRDLVLWVWKDSQNGLYGIGISRGEGHNHKMIVSSLEGHIYEVAGCASILRGYLELAIDVVYEGTVVGDGLTHKMVDEIVAALAEPPHRVDTAILLPEDKRVLH